MYQQNFKSVLKFRLHLRKLGHAYGFPLFFIRFSRMPDRDRELKDSYSVTPTTFVILY
jgi:hypothetical protein